MWHIYSIYHMTFRVLRLGAALLSGSATAQQSDATKLIKHQKSWILERNRLALKKWDDELAGNDLATVYLNELSRLTRNRIGVLKKYQLQ